MILQVWGFLVFLHEKIEKLYIYILKVKAKK